MACELGYILAAGARWRLGDETLVPFGRDSFDNPFVGFKPRPRLIRSLDMKSRPRAGRALVRFADSRGRDWAPVPSAVRLCREVNEALTRVRLDRCFPGSYYQQNDEETFSSQCDKGHGTTELLQTTRVETQIPDPVILVQQFICAVSDKLTKIREDMILCADEVQYIHELVALKQRRQLQALLRRFRGRHVLLPWPAGWVFTVMDVTVSARLQKVGSAIFRDGHICCDDWVLPVGVVHDLAREPDEAEHPVILVTGDGYVYMYDDGGVSAVLYILTKHGFSDFCRRGLRERSTVGMDVGSTPVDYEKEPLKSLLACRSSLDGLIGARDGMLGEETAIFHSDDLWTFICISDLTDTGYSPSDLEVWKEESGHSRLEPVFLVKACVGGIWVTSPVLVSDAGSVYYVDPSDSRVRFLAPDLYSFLVLGVMRFRNQGCFPRGTFIDQSAHGTRAVLTTRATYCPRGQRCKKKARPTQRMRLWRWFCNTWVLMTGCCR